MFTGIVTDIGTIEKVEQLDHGKRFRIAAHWNLADLDIGASVAHAGVCLTVVEKGGNWFETEAWEEALRLTTLSDLHVGGHVNLERSLRMGDELGGHLVSGHVDGKAAIIDVREEGGAVRFVLETPAELAKFIAPKGSVALDGTSLTVNAVDGDRFDVLLIRHTLEVTTWGERTVGDAVNIEIDQMARYAARLAETAAGG
ncbi:MAG: riboflavin synthase [Salaquimonas sp.]|jgi:riboflavin synthase|nr:riboflavin synthase [Salaquimonas sp.]